MQCAVRDMWCLDARPGNPEVGAAEEMLLKLASFKADQRPYRSSAANHVGAAVLAPVARSGRLDAAAVLAHGSPQLPIGLCSR